MSKQKLQEQKPQQPQQQVQKAIEGLEYSIIKSVGKVVDIAKESESRRMMMSNIILELAKECKQETLDKFGIKLPKEPSISKKVLSDKV